MHYRDNGLPKQKSGHWLCVIGISIVLLACVFAAWGDGEGKCMKRRLSHGGWVKITDHLKGDDLNTRGEGLEPYAHGHEKKYYDKNWKIIATGRSYSDIDFDDPNLPYYDNRNDDYVDCPTAPQPETVRHPQPEPVRRRRWSQTGSERRVENEEVIEEVTEQHVHPHPVPPPPRTPTCDTDLSFDFNLTCYNWEITEDYTLIGFPITPIWNKTIRELHANFRRELRVKVFLSQAFVDGRWVSYRGFGRDEPNQEIGDIQITPHLGLMVALQESVGFVGHPQQGEIIDLEPGIHLIGLPEVPGNFERASDFLSVDGVEWVKIGYSPSKHIDSQDDPDDQDLRAGQAIRIRVTNAVTLDLRGTAPAAAPQAYRQGTLTTSWGAMKR